MATFMVTLLVSVGFPVMVTLRVPSELTEEAPRVPARGGEGYRGRSLGGFVSRPDGVEVGWYPDDSVGDGCGQVCVAKVGLPENETPRVPSALTVAVPESCIGSRNDDARAVSVGS